VDDYRAEYRQSIRDLTAGLRPGEGPGWSGLRETLLAQGTDPAQAAVAVIYPDDVTILVAVVVTADRMLRVDIDYRASTVPRPWIMDKWCPGRTTPP
jgi:hypothetical protein